VDLPYVQRSNCHMLLSGLWGVPFAPARPHASRLLRPDRPGLYQSGRADLPKLSVPNHPAWLTDCGLSERAAKTLHSATSTIPGCERAVLRNTVAGWRQDILNTVGHAPPQSVLEQRSSTVGCPPAGDESYDSRNLLAGFRPGRCAKRKVPHHSDGATIRRPFADGFPPNANSVRGSHCVLASLLYAPSAALLRRVGRRGG
jgi:hypothetical protein